MSDRRPVSTRRPVPDDMFGGRLRGSYLLDLEVVGVDEVAPHVRLITMASSDLVGFEYTPGGDPRIAATSGCMWPAIQRLVSTPPVPRPGGRSRAARLLDP